MRHRPTRETRIRWLIPGLRVKRWFVVSLAGLAVMLAGLLVVLQFHSPAALTQLAQWLRDLGESTGGQRIWMVIGTLLATSGAVLLLLSMRSLMHTVAQAIDPALGANVLSALFNRYTLRAGRQIAALGGGTGLSTMLRGIKRYSSNITAVVTVTDDGGSSGRLVKDFEMLPPGDIRACLVALADAEPVMQELFQYRFKTGGDLSGHSFGNLLIAAMTDITGDFERAVRETSKVLAIRGRVVPSTLHKVRLMAIMEDGSQVFGESAIAASSMRIRQILLDPPEVEPIVAAVQAILDADLVVMGPGSVFTSVIPNLLVGGISDALRSTDATRVYVCNVMTQPGETDGFSASDHVRVIEAHLPGRAIDYVMVNTTRPADEVLERYRRVGAQFVEPDIDRIRSMGYRCVTGDFISQTDVVRHDPDKLAQAMMQLVRRRR